jgi:signal transduction histidine kinase
MKPADITDIIDHTLDLASAVLTSPTGLQFRDIQIERKYQADLPQVPCHPAELQQVFLSLFRHCVDALGEVDQPDHEPLITLQASIFYDALWVKVQHNGRGISLQKQQALFEPFFTDESQAADKRYGAAWRLSYPYFVITEQHRGQLAVTSEIDIGTTFHIELKLG